MSPLLPETARLYGLVPARLAQGPARQFLVPTAGEGGGCEWAVSPPGGGLGRAVRTSDHVVGAAGASPDPLSPLSPVLRSGRKSCATVARTRLLSSHPVRAAPMAVRI